MYPIPARTAYNEILAHIRQEGSSCGAWYCGVTSDPEGRLFGDHGVSREGDAWIACQCYTTADARNVERALLDLGCTGGAGGGSVGTTCVYAYRMSNWTTP